MREADIKKFMRWFRDIDFIINENGDAVLSPQDTLKLFDYKQEVEIFLARVWVDKPIKEVI